jgi:exocyst complex component 7
LNLNKLAWDQVDAKIIQPWFTTATVAFSSLFATEKQLCDSVFAGDHAAVGEAVFAAIVNDQATSLLAVAEAAVARASRVPERLFRVLDVHDTLAGDVLPAILSVFTEDSEVAALVIAKAAEAARCTLAGFEAAIHKEPSKATMPGGAVHPLTRYVMNYLVFRADYEGEHSASWVPRLVSAPLSKLESKAGSYRKAALSYLFLANNTHYVAAKVRGCSKLQAILGEGWAEAHGAKARGHVQVFVRATWGKVMSFTSTMTSSRLPHGAKEAVEAAVMEAVAMHLEWVAADDEMADALRLAATAAVVPKYRMFYRRYGAAVGLTPGDITTMVAALFTKPQHNSSSVTDRGFKHNSNESTDFHLITN